MSKKKMMDPMIPVPIPEQVPVNEGMAELPGTRLGYWDTGGSSGESVVLLHPASGSALIWLYQQPVFAKAWLPCHRLFAPQLLQLRPCARE